MTGLESGELSKQVPHEAPKYHDARASQPTESTSLELPDVVRRFGPMLQRLLAAYERDSQLREDLRQDLMVALWRALPNFRGDASLRTFVFRIAHNVALRHGRDQARARQRRQKFADEAPRLFAASDPREGNDQRELLRRVQEYLRSQPASDRQILFLHLEGVDRSEMSAITGLSRTNLGTRLNRLRQRMSEHLRPEEGAKS